MTGTTSLGLKKIDGTENWRNIFDYHNDSMDTLDQAVSSVENVEANFAVTIPVSGWVLVNGEYSYTWGNNTITSKTSVLVEFVENSDAVDVDYIEAEKITQGVKFTAPWIPNYPISVNIKITYAAETDISELTGDMVATDTVEGAANVDEALTELNSGVTSLGQRIDSIDPEAPSGIFSDVNFNLATTDWTLDSNTGLYNATITNTILLTASSGIQVFYDSSFRTALAGDIYANKTTGHVTFSTTAAPIGTLTGFIRIMDSTSGIVPVHRGGTGGATPRQARQNLNAPIRDIFVDFGTVTSLPMTVYDADLRANMVAFDAVFSNPSAIPGGIDVTFADPSGNVGGSATISGTIASGASTTISFWAHEKRTAVEGSEAATETQRVQDFVQTNEQTLTAEQKAQVLANIGAASNDSCGNIISEPGTYLIDGIFAGYNTGSGNYIDFCVPVYFAKSRSVTSARIVTSASVFSGSSRMNLSVPTNLSILKQTFSGLNLEMPYGSTQTANIQATMSAIVQIVVA